MQNLQSAAAAPPMRAPIPRPEPPVPRRIWDRTTPFLRELRFRETRAGPHCRGTTPLPGCGQSRMRRWIGPEMYRSRRASALRLWAARESLLDFAMAGALDVLTAAVARDHPPPKGHGPRIAHVFDDDPVARESVEDQGRRVPAHAGFAELFTDKEFRHSIVGGGFARS